MDLVLRGLQVCCCFVKLDSVFWVRDPLSSQQRPKPMLTFENTTVLLHQTNKAQTLLRSTAEQSSDFILPCSKLPARPQSITCAPGGEGGEHGAKKSTETLRGDGDPCEVRLSGFGYFATRPGAQHSTRTRSGLGLCSLEWHSRCAAVVLHWSLRWHCM